MQQTIRTFIALELPREVKGLLQEVQQALKRLKIRARWVRPENIHLTLKFLGDVNPDAVDGIGDAMIRAADGIPSLVLSVKGIGVFPGTKRPRVIWVGLEGDTRSLFALQDHMEEKLAEVGFPKDKRSFKAHLTLGRIKQAANPAVIHRMMNQYAGLSSEEFTCRQVILFKSDLKPSGAVYSKLKQVNFGMTNDIID